jgi:hypothetical protein
MCSYLLHVASATCTPTLCMNCNLAGAAASAAAPAVGTGAATSGKPELLLRLPSAGKEGESSVAHD